MDQTTAYVVCWLSIISIAACWKTSNKAYIQLDLGSCDSIVPERFKNHAIVTDSIPEPPPCLLKVEYRTPTGLRDIFLGNHAYEFELEPMPVKVIWPADDSKYYTLVMYDLDAPSRADHYNREVILWMVINIPGYMAKRGTVPGINPNSGKTLVEYVGPRPASGTGEHRIVWLVFSQGLEMVSETIFESMSKGETEYRLNFLTYEEFILENKSSFELTTPVAGNFILCSWKQGQPVAGFDGEAIGPMSAKEIDFRAAKFEIVELTSCDSIVPLRFMDFGVLSDSLPVAPPCILEVVYETSNGRRDIYLGNYADELDSLPVKVMWSADNNKYYSLLMYDMDSPSVSNPYNHEVILWMVGNIPGYMVKHGIVPGISPNSGQTLVDYTDPGPTSGTKQHRIIWLVYSQGLETIPQAVFKQIQGMEFRLSFFVQSKFILQNGSPQLITPIAGNFVQYSLVEKQPGGSLDEQKKPNSDLYHSASDVFDYWSGDAAVDGCDIITPQRFVDFDIVGVSIPLAPPCLLEIVYETSNGRRDIYLGNYADELEMASLPVKVMWAAEESKNYTLVMFDMDSPSRSDPYNREVLLWLVINIPGTMFKRGTVPGIGHESGKTLVEYICPRPASGTGKHRIIWLVYPQEGNVPETIFETISKTEIEYRLNFELHEEFILENRADYERITPIAGNFVRCSWIEGQPGAGFE